MSPSLVRDNNPTFRTQVVKILIKLTISFNYLYFLRFFKHVPYPEDKRFDVRRNNIRMVHTFVLNRQH